MASPGTDTVDTLMIDVRASTQGFAQDVAAMRSAFDGTVVDGFTRAGDVLERGLVGAIRRGSLGFDDLKRIALSAIDDIAAQAAKSLFSGIGGGAGGGVAGLFNLGGLLGSILGLPGRATGGAVSAGRGYVVGERGPELLVPTGAGQWTPTGGPAAAGREVRVSINVTTPPGADAPQSLQRSSRQVAAAVRRALSAN
jgi:hypothetical protein